MGLFDLPAGDYTWRAQKVGDAYADPMMKLVVHPATDGTMEALEALEGEAGELMEGACTDVKAGETITPGETCYNLVFDAAAAETTFVVRPTDDGQEPHALSGVSVFIGAAVFLATKPGYGTQGLLLAFSGGVYVYVAATEAAHTFLHKPLSICMKFGVFICFAIGAVAIGLVLLDHSHCSGDQDKLEDPHAGHNH